LSLSAYVHHSLTSTHFDARNTHPSGIDEEGEDRAILTHFTDLVKHIDQLATCRCHYDDSTTDNLTRSSSMDSNVSVAQTIADPQQQQQQQQQPSSAPSSPQQESVPSSPQQQQQQQQQHQQPSASQHHEHHQNQPEVSDENATAIMRTICDELYATLKDAFTKANEQLAQLGEPSLLDEHVHVFIYGTHGLRSWRSDMEEVHGVLASEVLLAFPEFLSTLILERQAVCPLARNVTVCFHCHSPLLLSLPPSSGPPSCAAL
jgi:hypothetical protein